MVVSCPECNSTDIETNHASGTSACVECGAVLEENLIVSEITFSEGSGGQSSVVGQFVSGSNRVASQPGQREPREITLANGRRAIQEVASILKLGNHHVDAAQRLYVLAVQNSFTQGRRTNLVAASCLYIVCRREKTPHMLLDFSDVVQVSTYVLGNTFLKLIRTLNLSLPITDPSLYIFRFASKLKLDEKTHRVAMTALRLVARMKRDWIQAGRRPAGICGAGLLLACRVHGFNRTHHEILEVVRVSYTTLKKRMAEFHHTVAGKEVKKKLSSNRKEAKNKNANPDKIVDPLENMSDCEEDNPPCYNQNRKKEEKGIVFKPREELILPDDHEFSDSEFGDIFLTEEESLEKTQVWMSENKDYLEEQQRKQDYEAKHGKPKPKKRPPSDGSTGQNAKKVLKEKKPTTKINFDALGELFDDDSAYDFLNT